MYRAYSLTLIMSDEKLDTPTAPTVDSGVTQTVSGSLDVASGGDLDVALGATMNVAGDATVALGGTLTLASGSEFKMEDGAGAAKVLTSSATGVGSWAAASGGSSWTYSVTALSVDPAVDGTWYIISGIGPNIKLPDSPTDGFRVAISAVDGTGSTFQSSSTPTGKAIRFNNQDYGGAETFGSAVGTDPAILYYDETIGKWLCIGGGSTWTAGGL
jgi:hypothetical protein